MNQNVQALQKAMSEETSTQDLQLAQRNVARIVSKHATLEAFDELVALYCGPRKLRGGDAWINAKLLETWSAKVTQSVLKTAYWVPADRPVLATTELKPFLVDSASLEDLPPTLRVSKVAFVFFSLVGRDSKMKHKTSSPLPFCTDPYSRG